MPVAMPMTTMPMVAAMPMMTTVPMAAAMMATPPRLSWRCTYDKQHQEPEHHAPPPSWARTFIAVAHSNPLSLRVMILETPQRVPGERHQGGDWRLSLLCAHCFLWARPHVVPFIVHPTY